MAEKPNKEVESLIHVNLKDPLFAAFLAWLLPGLGHLYQRRTAKGILFMACVLGTFAFGLCIGQGRVVYADRVPDEVGFPRSVLYRWRIVCQMGVGLPAMPALVQAIRVERNKEPLFWGFMAPPTTRTADDGMGDELDALHRRLGRYHEVGSIYTVIAGLLNVLVIYDAWKGPALFIKEESPPVGERDKSSEKKSKSAD